MEYIVQTQNLTKRYGDKIAVNSVNMNIAKGEIYGFIGRNGAGKTTTMKLLLGTSYPTSGDIQLFGSKNIGKERARIGSLIEAPGLYKNCTAYENMKRFSLIYGGTDKDIKDLLAFVGLGNVGAKKAGEFSLGMRQRLGIALAMLGNPELLILDEPINGLDPAGIKEIRDLILKLNHEREITVLVSSHLLDELSKITTRYGIINSGSLVEEVSAAELAERCKQYLKIVTDKPVAALDLIKSKAPEWKCNIEEETIKIYAVFYE
jgi:ABC transporter related protein